MSLVIGILAKTEIILVADSGSYEEDSSMVEIRRDAKVFERGADRDAMIFGYVGSFRAGQLLRYSLAIPRRRRGQDVAEFLSTAFIDSVRKCFRDGGVVSTDPDDSIEKGEQFFVGYEGRLFRIDSDYAVAEVATSFDAIGGGSSVAIGALWAQEIVLANARRAKREMTYNPHERALDALGIAERATTAVRKPFVTVRLNRPLTEKSPRRARG